MIKYLILLLGSFIFVWGCSTTGGGNPYTETAAICENPGLESQIKQVQDESTYWGGLLGLGLNKGGGAVGVERDKTQVARAYEVRDRLRFFPAEIEAMARNITSSCKNHARCMEANGYREGRCRSALARWENSEARLEQMGREFREIRAETKRLVAALDRPIIIKKGSGGGHPQKPYLNQCECAQSIGGVFANCCDHDSDYQRQHKGVRY